MATQTSPGIPAPQTDFDQIYTLSFISGATQLRHRHFRHSGDLQSAIARGRVHCEKTRNRFLFVTKFVEDLEFLEKRMEESQ